MLKRKGWYTIALRIKGLCVKSFNVVYCFPANCMNSKAQKRIITSKSLLTTSMIIFAFLCVLFSTDYFIYARFGISISWLPTVIDAIFTILTYPVFTMMSYIGPGISDIGWTILSYSYLFILSVIIAQLTIISIRMFFIRHTTK